MAAAAGIPLTVGGSIVLVTHEMVPIESIRVNPDNPRIRFQLKQRSGGKISVAVDDVMNMVREQPGYDALHKAIRKAGGIYEPIIIQHDGLVVEGNTRATIYKTLHAGSKDDPRWKSVLVARLPKDVPQHAVASLMASYHIAGKTVWRPYAQADQIYELRYTHDRTIGQIADDTRMAEREVEQYLEAYTYLVEEVLPEVKDGKGSDVLESKFSHALEFVKRKNLALLRKDPVVRKKLAKLIVEDKIKGAEVRELDKILKNRKASTALNKSGFKAAKAVLKEEDPVAASRTIKEMKAMTELLGRLGQEDLNLLRMSPKAQKILIALAVSVRDVASICRVKLKATHA